jgi:hypothetical protein
MGAGFGHAGIYDKRAAMAALHCRVSEVQSSGSGLRLDRGVLFRDEGS